jgi:vacuolar-type H+-ATPase subunit F/Vma7
MLYILKKSKELPMNFLMTTSGIGCIIMGYLNMQIAAQSATPTPESVFNWLAGIFSAIAGCICIAMLKHMSNEDKHLPKGISGIELVSKESCKEVHKETTEKTEAEIKAIKDDMMKKIDDSNNRYLEELEFTKDLVCMLLKKQGVDVEDIERKKRTEKNYK